MGIEATSSTSSVSSSSAATQAASTASSDNAKKTSSDSSFKDEMNKVSSSEKNKDESGVEKSDSKVNSVESKKDNDSQNLSSKDNQKDSNKDQDLLNGSVDYSQYGSMSVQNANQMLTNDIQRMMYNANNVSGIQQADSVSKTHGLFSFRNNDSKNTVSLTQSDAQFFINLTQTNDVSAQNIQAQANTMIASGSDVAEVKQNVQVSETLLNAINTAKENNQPLRIDFDQNVSVILRVGKDGAVAAHFIPGDKAVEQYLRNNIENLKATFVENDLPYTDLSYSNSSKQQNERRRQRQQQGE